MLDKQKSNTHYQELITACVSHELRNPLNSISSSNIEKAYLYDEIDGIIKGFEEPSQNDKISRMVKEL